MDPVACLRMVADTFQDQEWDECREALMNYWGWRRKGGFEPEGGDKQARWYGEQLNVVVSQIQGRLSHLLGED